MALNLRAPGSERYDSDIDHELRSGPRLGSAMSEWDREDAARNPAGVGEAPPPATGGLRRAIRGAFALLALAGFVSVLWYAYEWGLGGGDAVELPTVQAESGPEKEKPSDPGGLQVPYQDQLVLNEGEGDAAAPKVERLLPPPEVPLPPPAPALSEIAPSYDEQLDAGPVEGETGLVTLAPDTPEAPGDPVVTAAGTEQSASEPEPPAVEAPAPEPPAVASTEAQTTQTQTTQAQTTQAQTTQAQTTQAQATESQAAQTQAAETQTSQSQTAAGDFAVQLVSLKDSKAAEREWSRLQGVFPQLLGDKSLLLQSADIAGVGKVYRVRAGPFADRAMALEVCTQLKAKQQDCLVVNR